MAKHPDFVESYGDALVDSMAAGGIDKIFFTSGSDIPFYPEAIAKRHAHGHNAPEIVTIPHEITSLNVALGYAAFSERPVAVAAHVALGTQNYGSALHTAYRSHLPVLLTAGSPPTAAPGSMPGARDGIHFWEQQIPDQNGLVRQIVRWEHQVNYLDNPGTVVGRALQVALSEPAGPVYLSIPRETQHYPVRGNGFSGVNDLGVSTLGEPTKNDAQWVVRKLVEASNPLIVVGAGGRHRKSWRILEEFVEFFGVQVVNGPLRGFQAMEHSHPLYRHQTDDLSDRDFVLVLEQDLPWMPGAQAPDSNSVTISVDPDPIVTRMKLIDHEYDKRFVSDTATFISCVLEVARDTLSDDIRDKLQQRSNEAVADVSEYRSQTRERALSRYTRDFIDPVWAAATIADSIPEDALVLDDTIDSAPVFRLLNLAREGEHLQNQSSSGGWGIGAAVGAKLARLDQDVVMVSGDGFYMFGVPTAALWAARAHSAPFLGVVFQNDSYNTGTDAVAQYYPDGYAVHAGFPGGYLDPGVDFAAEAQASGAYGENVTNSEQLPDALERGWEAVRSGQAAVLAIKTPKLDGTTDWGDF